MNSKAQSRRRSDGIRTAKVEDVRVAYDLFHEKLARPTVRLPGLGGYGDYDHDFGVDERMRALLDAAEAMRDRGYEDDDDEVGAIVERAVVLADTLEAMRLGEPTEAMFQIAAALHLAWGRRTFGAADFLKALKKFGDKPT